MNKPTAQPSDGLREFSPAKEVGYLSSDGRIAVEVKKAPHSLRDFYASITRLATFLVDRPEIEYGSLVLEHPRLSRGRIVEEWGRVLCAFKDDVARRLNLIVLDGGETWYAKESEEARRIDRFVRGGVVSQREFHAIRPRSQFGARYFEILKVLAVRWLLRQGPIAMGKLGNTVGCSYPTVQRSLRHPLLRDALHFTSSRSVELRKFPRAAWSELTARGAAFREPLRYRDRTADRSSPLGLLSRLERSPPPHVALGGVLAARFWNPEFDLHGTPRLDLVCHAPHGDLDSSFVRRVDPALTLVDDPAAPAVLVVHPLVRSEALFERNDQGLPWADPVETALDLWDMSLAVQANQLLVHLRPEARLA